MWQELLDTEKNEYKKMILAFASLTEVFAQKADSTETTELFSPIINSKFQETVFQRAFHASAEDIGNTSYDVAMCKKDSNGRLIKYLIGIKTFGVASGLQKVAQFKANHDDWSSTIHLIKDNVTNPDGSAKDKENINQTNYILYKTLAAKISNLRNKRILSSISNLQGFTISAEDDIVQSIYHVLMPSRKGDLPAIHVGETSYDMIDIENIEILGCTDKKHPTNFDFFDGNHKYRFTSADSQLLMDFRNNDIIQETWDVKYVDDAYEIFSSLAEQVYGKETSNQSATIESHSWFITNKEDEVELFSGFNAFNGIGSKMGQEQRENTIKVLERTYADTIEPIILNKLISYLKSFLLDVAPTKNAKIEKINLRNEIVSYLDSNVENESLKNRVLKLLYRPLEEIYIPIPNSAQFHHDNPTFFCNEIGTFVKQMRGRETLNLNPDREKREFNLIFEPSGKSIRSYISQDRGKAIESIEKQSYLGEWILRGIFQLQEYEPLTSQKLKEIGINAIRLWKESISDDIHLQFIWLDKDNLPDDIWNH